METKPRRPGGHKQDREPRKPGPAPDRTPMLLPDDVLPYDKTGKNNTPEIKNSILQYVFAAIAAKSTLRKITQQEGIPCQKIILEWISESESMVNQYAMARTRRADARADRIDELTDMVVSGELDPMAARVAIDAEKWQASKENRKIYGDQVQIDGDGGASALLDSLAGLVQAISGSTRSLLPEDNPPLVIEHSEE